MKVSFIRFYQACQYKNLSKESFLYKIVIRHVNTKILQMKVSFIRFYQACQYKNLTKEGFRYKILSGMTIQKSHKGRFPL